MLHGDLSLVGLLNTAALEAQQRTLHAGLMEQQAPAAFHADVRDKPTLDQRTERPFTNGHEPAQLLEVKKAAGEICVGRGRLARVRHLVVSCSHHAAFNQRSVCAAKGRELTRARQM